MDPFATHLPLLLAVISKTSGPVLELGCGDFSTPILHSVCTANNRKLVSVDSKEDWCGKFTSFRNSIHEIVLVNDWDKCGLFLMNWDVVLVDHAPGDRRKLDIERLIDKAKYIVVHDTEPGTSYGYGPVLSKFKFRYDYKRLTPWTTVVSQSNLILEGIENEF